MPRKLRVDKGRYTRPKPWEFPEASIEAWIAYWGGALEGRRAWRELREQYTGPGWHDVIRRMDKWADSD
jgi:hypothetical protein